MTFINEGNFLGKVQRNQFDIRDCRARHIEEKNGLFKTGDIEKLEQSFFDSIEFLTGGKKPVVEMDLAINGPIDDNFEVDEARDDKTVVEENFNDEYDNLEAQDEQNKTNIADLKNKLADLDAQKTQINTKLKAEQKKLNALETQQENIQREQENITKQMKRLENIMQKRNSKSIQNRYQQLADKYEVLTGKLGELTEAISAQADKIADLKTQMNAVDKDYANAKNDIETAELEQTKNETNTNVLKAAGFLSSIVASTMAQIGMVSSLLALNFMADMANNVVVGAKNYINQQSAVSMLNRNDQKRVQQEGLDLTEKLPNGRNRFEILMNPKNGKAYLMENHIGLKGMSQIANKNSNLHNGYEYISLNGDGTINHQNHRGSTLADDFSQLRGNKNNYRSFQKAAFVSGQTKADMALDFEYSNPMEKTFKLGFLASRGAKQQMQNVRADFFHRLF